MDHNRLLDSSSPPVSRMTPELVALLEEMATVTRPPARRPRSLPMAVGGAGAVVALGLAGSAAAAVVVHYTTANVPDSTQTATFNWTSIEGHPCTLSVEVGPRPDSDPRYSSSQSGALDAARTWMDTFDVNRINLPLAERTWLRSMHHDEAGNPSVAELHHKYPGEELQRYALIDATTGDLSKYLQGRGFTLQSLNSGVGSACDE